MCGIFGIILNTQNSSRLNIFKQATDFLFLKSESRGSDSTGILIQFGNSIDILKGPIPASKFIKSKDYHHFWEDIKNKINDTKVNNKENSSILIMGHTRMVTNGTNTNNAENQPFVKGNIIGIYNGIITNEQELWDQNPNISRETTTDTELLFGLIGQSFVNSKNLAQTYREILPSIEGSVAFGCLSTESNDVLLGTNNGSLYVYQSPEQDLFLFVSEKTFISHNSGKIPLFKSVPLERLVQVTPNTAIIINSQTLGTKIVRFNEKNIKSSPCTDNNSKSKSIIYHNLAIPKKGQNDKKYNFSDKNDHIDPDLVTEFKQFADSIHNLKRCTRCILPETFPFIEFDKHGVCNYCRNHIPINKTVKGEAELHKIIAPHRKGNGEPDCFVAISGGRDSCYGLHYVKNVLKMTPLAYTYDWGMVTDLARRNISRMCGKLGVEHILISADIPHKRENVRTNIEAWLHKPELGMIPLFMAGDKQFLYYAHKLMKEYNINLAVWCMNSFEVSHFKEGFCGVNKMDLLKPERTWALTSKNKFKILWYYVEQYVKNPRYFNLSILDNIFAFYSYYILPEYNVYLYDYVAWHEDEIVNTLIRDYNWETSPDTTSTWRIGDGTAAFYNYIYYVVAGFSEYDTFLSNLIRENELSREEALLKSFEYNVPRYDTLTWYANTVGISLNQSLKIIHSLPKKYSFEDITQ